MFLCYYNKFLYQIIYVSNIELIEIREDQINYLHTIQTDFRGLHLLLYSQNFANLSMLYTSTFIEVVRNINAELSSAL